MQENEFENKIRNQMEEFSLVPNQEVWNGVEAKIQKENRRRFALYWLIAGLILTGGIGAFFFFDTTNNSELAKIPVEKKPVSHSVGEQTSLKKKDETFIYEKDTSKEAKSLTALSKPFLSAKKASVLRDSKGDTPDEIEKQTVYVPGVEQLAPTLLKKEDKALQQTRLEAGRAKRLPELKLEAKSTLPPHKYLLSDSFLTTTDTLQKSLTESNNKTVIRDTTVVSPESETVKANKQENASRPWNFGFTVYGGISDNVRGMRLGSLKSMEVLDARAQFSSPSAASINSVPVASKLQYQSSASYGAGAYVQRRLTRKLQLTAGLDYHFFSATSSVGSKVNSSLNIYDSALQKRTMVSSFYRAGQSNTFSNKYHLIQLPVNLAVQLNKNINHPLLFSLGLSPSLLIGTDALYMNSSARAYYTEKEQFNKFLLFGQSELLYTLSNKQKLQVSLGPALQYNFNSFSKPQSNTRQHLFFTGIKTNITFK